MNQFDEPIDPKSVEFFKFSGLVPDARLTTQQESFDIEKYPASVSLFAISNKFGQYVAATNGGFLFGLTKTLRSAIYSAKKSEIKPLSDDKTSVPLEKPARQIRFSADETKILIVLEGGSVVVYSTDDIQNQKGNVRPINSFELGNEIVDLRPNPEAYPNTAAVLYANQQCALIDFTTGNTECTFALDNITAICWSFKGKQIVCGKSDGGLQHFDIHGAVKDSLNIPEAMSAGHGDEVENRYVCDVLWIENHIFLATYARKRTNDQDDYINDGYIINRKPASGTEPVYTRLAEIAPIFDTEGRGNHFYMETIRGLGKEIKHLIIIANAASTEVSVVGHDENDEWATWQLPENGEANFPLSATTAMDTYPVGIAVDLTADEKLPAFDPSERDVGVDPMPLYFYLNNDGDIGAFHCYNIELARRGESFKTEAATSTTTVATPAAAPAVVASASSGFSAFGAATTSSGSDSSFADLLSGKSASPAASSPGGSSGFGSFGSFGSVSTSVPSFSNLGSAPKISGGFGSAAAAATTTPAAPTFGSSSSFGSAAANKTSSPLFGSTTSFGAAKASPAPAFGSTSSFGATANKPTASFGSTSSFGSVKSDSSSAFGSTAIATKEAAAEKPASGSESSVSSLNLGSFSTNEVKKPEAPKPAAPTSAFGSTSALGGSAFGSTRTLGSGGFGSLAKNTVPGALSPSTTIPATSAFGSSAKSTPLGATAPSTTATLSPTSPLKSPVAAAPAAPAAPTTTFGGFGALSKNTVPGAKSPVAAPTATFGGFGALSKSTVPGAKSPVAAPTFGSLGASITPSTTTAAPAVTPAPAAVSKTVTPPPATITPSAPKATTPTITAKPAAPVVSPPPTTIKATAPPAAAEPTREKLKPTAEDGMAKSYEELYITVTDEIEKLKAYHKKLTLTMQANTMALENKSLSSFEIADLSWNLNDTEALGKLAEELVSNIQKETADLQQTKQQVNALVQHCKNSMDKKEDINYLLSKDFNSEVVDILDNRELDAETKKTLVELSYKSDACEHVLADLEFKLQETKKRNKIRNAHHAGSLSMYALHRAIRDIEREIVHKQDDLNELADEIASIKLNDSRIKARRSAAGISCNDLSDSDLEEDQGESNSLTPAVIEHTTRYLRRYQFLDSVADEMTNSGPIYTSIE